MIPRRVLFGGAAASACRMSPDGRRLAWLARIDGAPELCVAPADDLGAAVVLTRSPRGVQAYAWVGGSHLVFAQDRDGDERFELRAVEVERGAVVALTPPGASARIYATSPEVPGRIAVGLDDRDPRWHDVYTIDVTTGARELVLRNDHRLFGFVFDRRLAVRVALRAEASGRTIVTVRGGEVAAWRAIAAEDELATWLVGLDRAGETLYWVGAEDRDTATLRRQRLTDAEPTEIAAHPDADVVRVVADPVSGAPIAACADPLVPVWMACGPGGDDVAWLAGELGHHAFEITSQTDDGQVWVVAAEPSDRPATYYRLDRAAGVGRARRLVQVLASRPELAGAPLVAKQPAIVTARDGLGLPIYLSLPAQREGPLPLVVWVHGGPWRRDEHAFDARHQWLADRGYAVLAVNFRGSTGFGKRFVNAGDREWGGKMHLDLLDAIDAVVASGVADPARVAIAGGSFGGYAALVGLTFTPARFACGISICGPANLETSQVNKPANWAAALEMRARRIGDPRTEAGRRSLAERSPIHRAGAIRSPLLVVHGANDPRVRRDESDRLVEAALRNGVAVTYLVYRDEGHGLVREPNVRSLYAVIEQFLAAHLGGRAEPLGGELDAAAVDVVAGGSHLGL